MIHRETDTVLIDRISNLPEVRPFICYHEEALDWSPVLESCVVLSNGEDAIGIFEEGGLKRIFQAHTLFAGTCRGKRAVEAGRAMVEFMFENDADALWGATPMSNPAARWFNRRLGAEALGTDTYEAEGPVELFIIRKGS